MGPGPPTKLRYTDCSRRKCMMSLSSNCILARHMSLVHSFSSLLLDCNVQIMIVGFYNNMHVDLLLVFSHGARTSMTSPAHDELPQIITHPKQYRTPSFVNTQPRAADIMICKEPSICASGLRPHTPYSGGTAMNSRKLWQVGSVQVYATSPSACA